MKFVSAKCPNCGSNLEVNSNKDIIKCEYCKGTILIDDAIAKDKNDVNNISKLENYLKLANRSYKNEDYDVAYITYGKVLEFDPNNIIAFIRYGICKTLLNNYIDFTLEYLITSFNETIKFDDFDKNSENIVNDILYAVDESLLATQKFYNTYALTKNDVINIQNKLMSIFVSYEMILDYTEKHKEYIMKQIVLVAKELLKDKKYKIGSSREGKDFFETYKINSNDKIEIIKKKRHYKKILGIDNVSESNSKLQNKFAIKNNGALHLIIDIILFVSIIGAMISFQLCSMLVMIIIFLIINFQNISFIFFKDDSIKKRNFIIILVIILFIFLYLEM